MLKYQKEIVQPKIKRYHNLPLLRVVLEQALDKHKVSVNITLPISRAQPTIAVLKILVKLGTLTYFTEIETQSVNKQIEVFFNYNSAGHCMLRGITLLSSAGNFRYIKAFHLKALMTDGSAFGREYILQTKQGIMTGTSALKLNIGGLLLYRINY